MPRHHWAERAAEGRVVRRNQRGAAAVEFALVLIPLLYIVSAVISFGVMLTFRQTLSQAAAEGARAAAVETNAGEQEAEALAAVNAAMAAVDRACGAGGLACDVGAPTACGDGQCITVTVTYAYQDNPMITSAPLIDEMMPEELEYAATVRIS